MMCLKFKITGRVQRIGFRYSTKIKADNLGITGYANNMPDRSVEVLACGKEHELKIFKEWLENDGPTFAKIDSVTSEEEFVEKQPDAFETF